MKSDVHVESYLFNISAKDWILCHCCNIFERYSKSSSPLRKDCTPCTVM